MQGILQPGSIPWLLGELFAEAATGVVCLNRGARTVCIGLREGRIVSIEALTGPRPEPAAPLAGALERRLATVLRDLGMSKPCRGALDRAALDDALSWQEGEYRFEERALEGHGPVALDDARLPDLVREAVRRAGAAVVRQALGDAQARLAPGRVAAPRLDPTPGEAALLARVDGERTIRELLESAGLSDVEASGHLLGLLCLGAVERVPRRDAIAPAQSTASAGESTHAVEATSFVDEGAVAVRRREIRDAVLSLVQADHFEALGVSRQASDQEVKRAYVRQARRFHPDRHAEPAFADLRQQLEALLIRMGEAYEVLRDPGRRARYAAELAAQRSSASGTVGVSPEAQARAEEAANDFMAEDAIRRAEQLLGDAQYFDAIQVLEPAIPLIRSSKLKHAAQVRLARAYAKNPYWVRRGEELLRNVVREDPSCTDAYFLLGTIYEGSDLRHRAIAMFRKVLELKPNHGPALAHVRSLERSAAAAGKPLGRS